MFAHEFICGPNIAYALCLILIFQSNRDFQARAEGRVELFGGDLPARPTRWRRVGLIGPRGVDPWLSRWVLIPNGRAPGRVSDDAVGVG